MRNNVPYPTVAIACRGTNRLSILVYWYVSHVMRKNIPYPVMAIAILYAEEPRLSIYWYVSNAMRKKVPYPEIQYYTMAIAMTNAE